MKVITLTLASVLLLWLVCLTNATIIEDDDADRSARRLLKSLEAETLLVREQPWRDLVAVTTSCTVGQSLNTVGYSLLGFSVALNADGTVAVVGAPFDASGAGSAFVYTRSGSNWSQKNKLTTSTSASELGQFGYSVAISADANHIVVGEPNSNTDQGAAYYYNGNAVSGYALQQTLSGVGSATSVSHFGVSVTINSQYLAVGGFANGTESGIAWTFQRSGLTWTRSTNLLAGSGQTSSFFGWSVSLSYDDVLVIGCPGDDSIIGSTFAFRFDGPTSTWKQIGSKVSGSTGSQFGYSVSTNKLGTVALIGGPRDNNGQGAAWVYDIATNQLTLQQKFSGTGLSVPSGFGSAVALSANDADFALIGAPLDNSFAGAAMLFEKIASTWTQQGSSLLTSGGPGLQIGYSVAISANATAAIVGEPFATTSLATTLTCFPPPPTSAPTNSPTTSKPTASPTTSIPTQSPSTSTPTASPTTSTPTTSPTTSKPTASPSNSPTTSRPSATPTKVPTTSTPTTSPTASKPTASPSNSPTTSRPSAIPTKAPTTSTPTLSPTTSNPTASPSNSPTTSRPSATPTKAPTTSTPTLSPTTSNPTASPSTSPTTSRPSATPTKAPTTSTPTSSPSTSRPSAAPSTSPTTSTPTTSPTTSRPTVSPSKSPTFTRPNDAQCRSSPGMKIDECNRIMGSCLAKHAPMKWVGTGCVIKGKRQLDGGCQCVGFCGYKCLGVCNNDSECTWRKAAKGVKEGCYHKVTGKFGGQCLSS